MAVTEWVLLAYRLPREPSTPRIVLWRKLRRLGALQLVDGLVALPADPRTAEAFDWLADEVVEAGGEAWTWRGQPGSKAQQKALHERMLTAIATSTKTSSTRRRRRSRIQLAGPWNACDENCEGSRHEITSRRSNATRRSAQSKGWRAR